MQKERFVLLDSNDKLFGDYEMQANYTRTFEIDGLYRAKQDITKEIIEEAQSDVFKFDFPADLSIKANSLIMLNCKWDCLAHESMIIDQDIDEWDIQNYLLIYAFQKDKKSAPKMDETKYEQIVSYISAQGKDNSTTTFKEKAVSEVQVMSAPNSRDEIKMLLGKKTEREDDQSERSLDKTQKDK
jgi:hypothetical protein